MLLCLSVLILDSSSILKVVNTLQNATVFLLATLVRNLTFYRTYFSSCICIQKSELLGLHMSDLYLGQVNSKVIWSNTLLVWVLYMYFCWYRHSNFSGTAAAISDLLVSSDRPIYCLFNRIFCYIKLWLGLQYWDFSRGSHSESHYIDLQ